MSKHVKVEPAFVPFSMSEMTEQQQADLVRKVLDVRKYESKPWTKFKLDAVKVPTPNSLVCSAAWWVITPCNCVLAHNSTLQCNSSEELAAMLMRGVHRYCTLQYHETLFIPLSSWEIRQ